MDEVVLKDQIFAFAYIYFIFINTNYYFKNRDSLEKYFIYDNKSMSSQPKAIQSFFKNLYKNTNNNPYSIDVLHKAYHCILTLEELEKSLNELKAVPV